MAFQYFYICGTGKISNTIINFFKRQTKKKTITKSSRSRKKTKAVKKFKPIYSLNIIIKSEKHILILNLPKLVVRTLVRSERLSKKYIKMDCRNHVVEATGKIHKPKWFKGSLNATERLVS